MSSRRQLLAGVLRALPAALLPARRARAAVLMRYPYLQDVGRNRATLVWTTLDDGGGAVRYSTDRSFGRAGTAVLREMPETETGLAYSYFRHKVEITDLQEDTRYYYRVFHETENLLPGDELSFRTAGGGSFRFLAFGDSGAGTIEQRQLAAYMLREQAALAVHTGDVAYPTGRFEDFEIRHFDVYRDLFKQIPFFPSPGNHEYYSPNAYPYLAVFETPTAGVPEADRGRYYSFNWGPAHFVSLDVYRPLTDATRGRGPMLDWLDRDLAATELPWKIVYFHQPPYAWGPNQRDAQSALVREWIVPIMERRGVQLVLNGHEHSYQRSVPIRQGGQAHEHIGTVYITTGGGGASLYDVYPNPLLAGGGKFHHYMRLDVDGIRIRTTAVGRDGAELDQAEVVRPPTIGPAGMTNAVAGVNGVCSGGLVSVFGQHLGARASSAAAEVLPIALAGTRLLVNGEAAPLLFVSPTQVNAQLPFGLSGRVHLRLETEIGAAEFETSMADAAPGILAVARPDGSLVTQDAPARAGEQLVVLAAGLGPVEGAVQAGQPPAAGQTAALSGALKVDLSGESLTPSFAGLAPGTAGLYQVVFQTPSGLQAGPHLLELRLPSASSNAVEVPVG